MATEAGLADTVRFTVGDGAKLELVASDVVILDKVICCYPEVDELIKNSLRATSARYAFVVPLSKGFRGLLARAAIRGENAIRRIRGQAFRAYVHDVGRIEQLIAAAGLERVASARRFIWYIAVHERDR